MHRVIFYVSWSSYVLWLTLCSRAYFVVIRQINLHIDVVDRSLRLDDYRSLSVSRLPVFARNKGSVTIYTKIGSVTIYKKKVV